MIKYCFKLFIHFVESPQRCKCLRLPFHLCFAIIFYFKTKELRLPLKLNPCGEEMWNTAVELVREMCLSSLLTLYLCV